VTAHVEFDRVWKKFRRGLLHDSLRDFVPALVRQLARGAAQRQASLDEGEFWALQDVSFRVDPGEALGIIGPNGAGKSTVLKLLIGILRPTRGRAHIEGRTGALIELAAGFHPDLTGRENVFLQGAIMGMKRNEIQRQFDRIVAFAELSEFIDTQVKRYSSGMSARLGFAIAAHLDPEVLVIDEILSVGDRAFQRKAFDRLGEIARREIPVVIVSHQLDRVAELCSKAVLLNRGRVVRAGSADECISHYVAEGYGSEQTGLAWGPLELRRLSVEPDLPIRSGAAIAARVEALASEPLPRAHTLMVRVRHIETGEPLFSLTTRAAEVALPEQGAFTLSLDLEANLAGGMYLLEVCVWDVDAGHEASPSLRRTFHVREDHDFHGSVNLHGRFAVGRGDALPEPSAGVR
jgi:ABC-type polysaccharide/polyol phosphate transport system ATPase subunit